MFVYAYDTRVGYCFILACARIGAIHSVVFGGFSASTLSARINDAQCKILITVMEGLEVVKLPRLS